MGSGQWEVGSCICALLNDYVACRIRHTPIAMWYVLCGVKNLQAIQNTCMSQYDLVVCTIYGKWPLLRILPKVASITHDMLAAWPPSVPVVFIR